MDANLVVLSSLVVVAFAVALVRDVHLPLRGLEASGRLLRGVWRRRWRAGSATSARDEASCLAGRRGS